MADEQKFKLNIGCHRGTLISRDSAQETYDTYAEAFSAYEKHRAFYRSIGYMVWFAEIVSPDGTKANLESNPYW